MNGTLKASAKKIFSLTLLLILSTLSFVLFWAVKMIAMSGVRLVIVFKHKT